MIKPADIKILTKDREVPGLWRDLSTFIHAGGPEEEHRADAHSADQEEDF